MIVLSNEYLSITITEKGAELISVIDRATGYEFMWQGNPKYWARQAPVLFPIVGSLVDNTYTYQGNSYQMSQHGFARDMVFNTQAVTENSATFFVKSDEATKAIYPFDFSFQITYILFEDQVSISYEVLNPSTDAVLYYSLGGHPGFNVSHHRPLKGQPEFENVQFTFDPPGSYYRIPIADGRAVIKNGKFVPVDNEPILHKTFKRDAQVFQIPVGTKAILKDPDNDVSISMTMTNFDYLGVWSSYPKKAGFVCLEPWAGITDIKDATGKFEEKYGIKKLEPGKIRTHDYTIQFTKSPRKEEVK